METSRVRDVRPVATTAAGVGVKGGPVSSLVKFLQVELSPEQFQQAVSRVDPAYKAKLSSGRVMPIEVFPLSVLNQLTLAGAAIRGEQPLRFAERAGRAAAKDAVSGIYRFLATLVTPTKLLARASGLFSTIYTHGTLSVENETANGAEVVLRDFPSEPVGCARISGWMRQLAEHTRVRDIDVQHLRCAAKHDDHCRWSVSWR